MFQKLIKMSLTIRRILAKGLLCLVMVGFSANNYADQIERSRLEFSQAIKSLEVGDYDQFLRLSNRNRDYLLHPYLRYYDLRSRLSSVSDIEIEDFIKDYADTPLGNQLHQLWVKELVKQKRWGDFLREYRRGGSTQLQCQYLYAKYQNEKSKNARGHIIIKAKELWMTGEREPEECIPLFEMLYDNKLVSQKMLWDRIGLAMKNGRLKLVAALALRLDKKDRKIISAWTKVRKNPPLLTKLSSLKTDNKTNRKIVIQTVKRYARSDAEKGLDLWGKLKKKYKFSNSEAMEMDRYIALRSSYQLHPKAFQWLAKIKPKWVNDDVRLWRARAALRNVDWPALHDSINDLKKYERNDRGWQYWLARAKENIGQHSQAEKIYKTLSEFTNYYGFMASDRIDTSYTFRDDPLESDPRRLILLESLPGMQRSRELYLLDRLTEARREWNYAMKKFDEPKIKLASVMAYQWQWYDNAINTVARTIHRSDLQLRFPTPYRDVVEINAESNGIDPSWIYGVVRRESAYKIDARSGAGALGLMQLMPGTARLISRKLGLDKPNITELFTAEGNIKLGSAYLNQMLQRFEGSQALATAAYNAGPRRVEKWIPQEKGMPVDVWVDTVPYKETREYVQAVMAYAVIFDRQLSERVKTLKERMGVVPVM